MEMNGNMNGDSWYTDQIKNGYYTFRKASEIVPISPTMAFVFLDEHPDSINDGWFVSDPARTTWVDIPATYHNGANGMAYADGHSEIKKWRDPAVLGLKALPGQAPKDKGVDLRWLNERTTY